MPIWSLTNERLDKLKNQIAAKKAEHDELEALSEKDLWMKDLDDFVEEWHTQLKLEEEITTGIRRMGRRTSQKIGAGKGRRVKDDDDYQPDKKGKGKAAPKPKVEKVETKTHQRFTEKFQAAAKPKPQNDLSDDDFALLGKKAAVKEESQPPPSVTEVTTGRTKRAAATKSKYVLSESEEDDDEDFMELDQPEEPQDEVMSEPEVEEIVEKPVRRAAKAVKPSYMDPEFGSDSEEDDDDDMLGDVGAMVKGIGGAGTSSSNGGRLSLFAMSRPEAGETPLPKMKSKQSKSILDVDDHDDTNYEALAMSSPRKSTKPDDLDDFLSDDDLPAVVGNTTASTTASKSAASSSNKTKPKAPLAVVPAPAKKRGRPAGAKNKPKPAADDDDDEEDDLPAPKPKAKAPAKTAAATKAAAKPKPKAATGLSPAAKAYAAKKAKAKTVISDDEDEEMDDLAASPPPARAKARPGRAAAARAKPVYLDDDSEDAFDMDEDSD